MGQGGMCVEAKRKDTSMCEWVTMGWGLFFDTYMYLTLHVVDVSISLSYPSLSLSLPSSQLHISLSLCFSSHLVAAYWVGGFTMTIFKKQSLKTGNASRTKASELTLRQSICTTQHLTQKT